MKKTIRYSALGLAGLLLTMVLVFAATFSLPELKEFEKIRILELKEKRLLADFVCKVRNDNFYALRAYDLDYVVSYNDTVIGTGNTEKLRIGASGTTQLNLPASIELKGVAAIHKTMLATPQCTLKILVNGRFSRLRIRHEFVAEAVISPKSFLSSMLDKTFGDAGPEFKNIRLESVTPSTSRFHATAEFRNSIPIPYTISDMDMEVSGKKIRGKTTGSWKLEKPVPVKAGGLVSIPVELEMSNLGAGKDILSQVFKRLKRYYVWGNIKADLDGMEYEIPVEGVFEFDMLRQKWDFKNL